MNHCRARNAAENQEWSFVELEAMYGARGVIFRHGCKIKKKMQ